MDKSSLRYLLVILVVLAVLGLIGLRVMNKVETYATAQATKEVATQMVGGIKDMVGGLK